MTLEGTCGSLCPSIWRGEKLGTSSRKDQQFSRNRQVNLIFKNSLDLEERKTKEAESLPKPQKFLLTESPFPCSRVNQAKRIFLDVLSQKTPGGRASSNPSWGSSDPSWVALGCRLVFSIGKKKSCPLETETSELQTLSGGKRGKEGTWLHFPASVTGWNRGNRGLMQVRSIHPLAAPRSRDRAGGMLPPPTTYLLHLLLFLLLLLLRAAPSRTALL